jgi:hypothetical protein
VILGTKLNYPAYHGKTLLDMCWDYDLESYAMKEDGASAIADLTEDSTLFDTKSPVKINDEDPTNEDLEENVDFVCGPSCVCDLCDKDLVLYYPKYKHQREETPEPSELSVERMNGMCEYTLIQRSASISIVKISYRKNKFIVRKIHRNFGLS